MNIKHMFLILISLVMMIVVSGFVAAVDGVNASLTSVLEDATAVTPLSGVYYLNNGTYLFNFTIENLNGTNNVTGINISLDSVFIWGGGNWTDIAELRFSNTPTSLVRWNRTADPYVLNVTGHNSSWFAFNATIANSSDDDGNYNFTIQVEYDNVTGGKAGINFNVDNNITVDNIAPVLSSAVTNSTTTINLTFTETNGLLNSSLQKDDFYVVVNNASGSPTNHTATNTNFTSSSLIQTITVSAFSKNETPVVYINGSNATHNVTDYAGNTLLSGNQEASDKIRPSLLSTGLEYNYGTKNLTLIFDEPIGYTGSTIYVAGITLRDNVTGATNFLTLNDENASYTVYAGGMNKTVINFSDSFRDTILGWKPGPQTGLNITLLATAFNDTSNNSVDAVNNQTINTYTIDTTDPYLTSAKYNHDGKNLNLTFSETIDVSVVNVTNIYVGNQTGLNYTDARQVSLNGASASTTTNSSTVIITLTEALAANLSEWRVSILYIWFYPYNITSTTDLTGRNVTPISNQTALGWVNRTASTYTNDSTAPVLSVAIVLDDPSPTKAGVVVFNVTFNEYMDRGTTISVTLHSNESDNTTTIANSWHNYTFWNGSYAIPDSWKSTAEDGLITINVSGARDVAHNVMDYNDTNNFIIDTTPPTLEIVWYNDTGYDYNESIGTQDGTDFLILKFSENVTTASADDTTAIHIANSSSLSNAFEGNSSASQGAIFKRLSDYKKVKVAINKTMTIWIRGIYNGTGKVQGIIPNNDTSAITDEAGNNLVNHSGVKDIYDNVFEWTADASGVIDWQTFSVPHDVNSTATWNALNGTDAGYEGVVYTHNGTAWITASATSNDFIPLRGYFVKITGMSTTGAGGTNATLDMPIQTDLRGSPSGTEISSYTTSVKIDDGAYALVGVNSYLDNGVVTNQRADGEFLASIGTAGDKVNSIVYADTLLSLGTPAAIGENNLMPYRAYWMQVNNMAGSNYYDFMGYALSTKYPI